MCTDALWRTIPFTLLLRNHAKVMQIYVKHSKLEIRKNERVVHKIYQVPPGCKFLWVLQVTNVEYIRVRAPVSIESHFRYILMGVSNTGSLIPKWYGELKSKSIVSHSVSNTIMVWPMSRPNRNVTSELNEITLSSFRVQNAYNTEFYVLAWTAVTMRVHLIIRSENDIGPAVLDLSLVRFSCFLFCVSWVQIGQKISKVQSRTASTEWSSLYASWNNKQKCPNSIASPKPLARFYSPIAASAVERTEKSKLSILCVVWKPNDTVLGCCAIDYLCISSFNNWCKKHVPLTSLPESATNRCVFA